MKKRNILCVRPTTREVVLDSCPDSYYNININLGEKAEEQNKIGRFVLRHFKSVTVHLLGRLHQVSYSHLALKGILAFFTERISFAFYFYEHPHRVFFFLV